MKNEKEFDYDKKKPFIQKFKIKNIPEMKKEKTEDLSSIFNQPPLIKGIEVTKENSNVIQKNSKKLSKKEEKTQTEINKNEKKEKENIKIEKEDKANNTTLTLPESEIINPDTPLEEGKKPNINFCKNLLENIYEQKKSEINIGIMDGIEGGLNNIMNSVQDDIQANKLQINSTKKNLNELTKNNISLNNKNQNYETLIKIQKINELNNRKKSIEKQINKIEENIKVIKDEKIFNQPNKLNIPVSVIEQNIKNDQIKENKHLKELLLSKLNGINEQVNKLMENEEELNQNKKINVKDFLENFEKDKLRAEEQARKYSEEKKIREQKILNSVMKGNEKREKEYNLLQNEEKEKKKKELEKIRMKELERIRERKRENKEKLDHIREHAKDKAENENKYLFKVLENQYKKKVEQEIKKEILKKREKIREGTVTREEIIEFDKKQKELELKRIVEMEEEKKKLKEQWKQIKDILPKFESSVMQKLKEEENQMKEQKEFEENKKKAKIKEVKNYSQTVQKLFLPKINENVRKEREDRIKNLNVKNNIKKIQRKKNSGRVLLVKPDPNKPKKYNWELKIKSDNKEEQNNINNHKENPNLRSKSASKKHRPLDKLPDYLTEMRIKNEDRNHNTSQRKYRPYNWDKMLKNGNLVENVEMIKQKAEHLEREAKMNEKLLNTNGNDVDLQQKVSNYLIDAIKAKLSILDNIGKK